MAVPYTFGSATTSIPLSQLDSNFATTITLGNTAIQLGNTVTTLNNMTLANVTISSGTSNLAATAITNGTSNVTIASSGGNISMATNGTTAITIDTSQIVGIGTTSPSTYSSRFSVNGNSTGRMMNIDNAGANGANVGFSNNGTDVGFIGSAKWVANGTLTDFAIGSINNLIFSQNGNERARIDSGGSLLVGMTTTSVSTTGGVAIIGSAGAQSYLLNCSTTGAGTSMALFYSSYSVANQTKFEVDAAGNVKSRTNSYAGFSDERLKQNITPASSQWNDIKSYDVVKFQMKSEQFSDEENPWMIGVVAQQVEQTSPGLVDVDPKDGMKTVKYSILYMKAVKALQEAMTRIETLEAKADTQAETINALTARIVALEAK